MQHLKPVFLCSSVDPSTGWGRYARELCLALHNGGIPFELHLPSSVRPDPSLPFRDKVKHDLPEPSLTFRRRWWRAVPHWLASLRVRVDGDIIYSLVEFPYGGLARLLARRRKLPFGLTVYGSYAVAPFKNWFDRRWFSRAVRDASVVIAISRSTRDRLIAAYGAERPVKVVPCAVDLERFAYADAAQKEEARKHLGLQADQKIILFAGALKPRKGLDVLITAFQTVRARIPDAHLMVVGSGDPRPYQQLAEELGVSKEISFRGTVSDAELVECFQACDVFVLLSREQPEIGHFEGFGLVYLEANACGKPVVGAYAGGVSDAVNDGVSGTLVAPEDPEAAARAISALLESGQVAIAQMGRRGREWAEQHSWSTVVDAYMQLLRPEHEVSPDPAAAGRIGSGNATCPPERA